MDNERSMMFRAYAHTHLLEAIKKDEVGMFSRVILQDEVLPHRIYSKMGFKGDVWYIAEQCAQCPDGIVVHKDGMALQRLGEETAEISTDFYYDDERCRMLSAQEMPKWASRYLYEITDVTRPVRFSELTPDHVQLMGVRQESRNVYRWGDWVMQTPYFDDFKYAFAAFWDQTLSRTNSEESKRNMSDNNPYLTLYMVKRQSLV